MCLSGWIFTTLEHLVSFLRLIQVCAADSIINKECPCSEWGISIINWVYSNLCIREGNHHVAGCIFLFPILIYVFFMSVDSGKAFLSSGVLLSSLWMSTKGILILVLFHFNSNGRASNALWTTDFLCRGLVSSKQGYEDTDHTLAGSCYRHDTERLCCHELFMRTSSSHQGILTLDALLFKTVKWFQ